MNMKFDFKKIKDIFNKSSKSLLECIPYCHTTEYSYHMANAVAIEKKILSDRGIDEFNVGHNTRSFEIEKLIDDELFDAKKQMNDHLNDYKKEYDKLLSDAAVKKGEANQLRNDLVIINRHIQNLESNLSEGGSEE